MIEISFDGRETPTVDVYLSLILFCNKEVSVQKKNGNKMIGSQGKRTYE